VLTDGAHYPAPFFVALSCFLLPFNKKSLKKEGGRQKSVFLPLFLDFFVERKQEEG
jgi:hypothetical protein